MTQRTLTIGFPYAADRFGGSNASSLVLARALVELGHQVRILAHGEGRVIEEVEKLGLPLERLPALSAIPGYARPDRFRVEQVMAFGPCRAAIARMKLDIVHTNDLGMLRTWAAPAFTAGAALVAHWRSNYLKSWSVDTGLRIARAVIAVSRYSAGPLPEWTRPKTFVEYNPFDLQVSAEQRSKARASVRARLGLPQDAAIIGVFGHHIARKRAHVLADVLAKIERTADGRAVFGLACGDRAEPYNHLLDEKIVAHKLEARLLRPGFVRPVEEWITACDAVFAPAVNEPLARSVLEAQALEVPVAVSTDGGLREVIVDGGTGLLCDPYDLDAWVAAARRLLDDRTFAHSLARAARDVVRALRPEAHARRVTEIYRTALGQPKQEAA